MSKILLLASCLAFFDALKNAGKTHHSKEGFFVCFYVCFHFFTFDGLCFFLTLDKGGNSCLSKLQETIVV